MEKRIRDVGIFDQKAFPIRKVFHAGGARSVLKKYPHCPCDLCSHPHARRPRPAGTGSGGDPNRGTAFPPDAAGGRGDAGMESADAPPFFLTSECLYLDAPCAHVQDFHSERAMP